MPLIKSHSNYVLKSKHQLAGDGTIFERDITTIGGVNKFVAGQLPIYKSGNFIISVRNDGGGGNQYNTSKWEKGVDGDIWTLDTVKQMISSKDEDDTKIVLKNDYYDLRDFAYYGSLTEMIQASILDIADRFPGELFFEESTKEDSTIYYTISHTEDFEKIEDYEILGGVNSSTGKANYFSISNPFGINVHTEYIPDSYNKRLFFANDGWKNYDVITKNGAEYPITAWTVTNADICDEDSSEYSKIYKTRGKIGDLISTIVISYDGGSLTLYAYLGDNREVVYLHESASDGFHIRPNKDLISQFYNQCNDFQKILLNEDTTPKYSATFSIIKENDFGYYRTFETFVFPMADGGNYNIGADDSYINSFVEIGEFYDERFCDILYRNMTHESIKNFDWSLDNEDEYEEGGEKIQKALRIFAREFDEIKMYIDNIANLNRITYDERDNLPDYFLADVCEDEGWDLRSVMPYTLKGITSYNQEALMENTAGSHLYSQESKTTVKPYTKENINDGTKDGYFVDCEGGSGIDNPCLKRWYKNGSMIKPSNGLSYTTAFSSGRIEYVIKSYTSEREYTYMGLHNEFLRRLKLNSKNLWRHKGTLEGIEMMLGMFGLRSKRWLCKSDSCRYSEYHKGACGNSVCGTDAVPDYEIIEYTQFTNPIVDEWDQSHSMFHIDWVNSTKTITYDYRNVSNYNSYDDSVITYTPYQGLPVAYGKEYTESGKLKRKLYPNFDKNEQIDGNIYFQMDGGWLSKTLANGSGKIYQNFQFDVDDNIVSSKYIEGSKTKVVDDFIVDNHRLYKETVRSIKRVDNLSKLIAIPQNELKEGFICYVSDIEKNVALIEGGLFDIHLDGDKKYVIFTLANGYIKVGRLYFSGTISVYNINGDTASYGLDGKDDGYTVKAYFKNDGSFLCQSTNSPAYKVSEYQILNNNDNGYSNYYMLNDVDFSDSIATSDGSFGWRRLEKTDPDYLRINTIVNYYKGNNGHNGNLSYDSGHEYFTYFQRLFKYAEDNDLFDPRCFDRSYYDVIEELYDGDKPIGFSGLINPEERITQYDNYLHTDTKVHYFGNYKTKNGTIKKYTKLNDALTTIDGINPYSGPTYTDPVTNQIVNNKRMKIVFNMKYNFASEEGQKELKYIDEVVMNYLTQMIPSTVIFETEYRFCGYTYEGC